MELIEELITKIKVWSGAQRGRKRSTIPGHRITAGVPKSPNHATSTFFNTEHLFPKDIRFEHEGTKLVSCPGLHLASLRPWVWWVLQKIISLTYPVGSH